MPTLVRTSRSVAEPTYRIILVLAYRPKCPASNVDWEGTSAFAPSLPPANPHTCPARPVESTRPPKVLEFQFSRPRIGERSSPGRGNTQWNCVNSRLIRNGKFSRNALQKLVPRAESDSEIPIVRNLGGPHMAFSGLYALFEEENGPAERMIAGFRMHDLATLPQSYPKPDRSHLPPEFVLESGELWSLSSRRRTTGESRSRRRRRHAPGARDCHTRYREAFKSHRSFTARLISSTQASRSSGHLRECWMEGDSGCNRWCLRTMAWRNLSVLDSN